VKFTPELQLDDDKKIKKEAPASKKDKRRNQKYKPLHNEYMNLVEELSDFNEWCISEMGHWGTPVPYFIHKKTGNFL